MRQLWVTVPSGQGESILKIAQAHDGVNLAQFSAWSEGQVDVVLIHVSNRQVENLLGELDKVDPLEVTLHPQGVITLHPPADAASEQVKDVQGRSPIEIFLAGLQSVGSWWGFLSYAALGGVIVWTGLYTDTIYLLVAAMLIAPFAGPAMNVAIATARGDRRLIWRGLGRYFAAILVTVAVAALLSWVFRQQSVTVLMFSSSKIAAVAVLLPLAAGAAGAINLVQSQQSSLVSGAAVGLLIAASLAPPAGTLGMALALGRWEMMWHSAFLLLLQLVGINLAAAIIFRLKGLSPQGARYSRGQQLVYPVALGATTLVLVGLLTWQFSSEPVLQRSTYAQRMKAEVQQVVSQADFAYLIDSNIRFTDSQRRDQDVLLCLLYVQPTAQTTLSAEAIRDRISQQVRRQLQRSSQNVLPLVDVTVLDG